MTGQYVVSFFGGGFRKVFWTVLLAFYRLNFETYGMHTYMFYAVASVFVRLLGVCVFSVFWNVSVVFRRLTVD